MYQTIIALFIVLFSLSSTAAESFDLPGVKSGDKWAYKVTVENKSNNGWSQKIYELAVIRASAMKILLSTKERGSTMAPSENLIGSDWSKFRSINGEETMVSQPLKFPLSQGKSWVVEYGEANPNNQLKNSHNTLKYSVIGWEDVEVPAGKFKALKIEADGQWKGELAPSIGTAARTQTNQSGSTIIMQSQKVAPKTITGRLYRAYWYVPQVKIYVKSIDESYSSNGNLSRRTTEELESFTVAPEGGNK